MRLIGRITASEINAKSVSLKMFRKGICGMTLVPRMRGVRRK